MHHNRAHMQTDTAIAGKDHRCSTCTGDTAHASFELSTLALANRALLHQQLRPFFSSSTTRLVSSHSFCFVQTAKAERSPGLDQVGLRFWHFCLTRHPSRFANVTDRLLVAHAGTIVTVPRGDVSQSIHGQQACGPPFCCVYSHVSRCLSAMRRRVSAEAF